MNWADKWAAVVPCHNEASTIGGLVTQIRAFLPRAFVVDDGSTDGTVDRARDAGAVVLRQDGRRGKGVALAAGWRAARLAGCDWVLNMDGDGQHSPSDIPAFQSAASSGNWDMVVGNRMAHPGAMPWLRLTVNRWMSRRISALTGLETPDSQCGYRLIRLAALEIASPSATRFEIESELLVAFARSGLRVGFVPVATIYSTERSKICPMSDTVRWLRWWVRARIESRHRTLATNARAVAPSPVPS